MLKLSLIVSVCLFSVAHSAPQRQTDGDASNGRRLVPGPVLSQFFEDLKGVRNAIREGHPPPSPLAQYAGRSGLLSALRQRINERRGFRPTTSTEASTSVSPITSATTASTPSNSNPPTAASRQPELVKPTQEPQNREQESSVQEPLHKNRNEEIDNPKSQENVQEEIKVEDKNKEQRNNGEQQANKKPRKPNKNKQVAEEKVNEELSELATGIAPPPGGFPGVDEPRPGNLEGLLRGIITAPCTGGLARSGSCRESFD